MPLTGPDVSDLVTTVSGLPKPDWDAIARRIDLDVSPDGRFAAWTCVVRQWMDRLCSTLVEAYGLAESEHFLAVVPENVWAPDVLLGFAERCRRGLLDVLPHIGAFSAPGKEALVLFRDRATCDKYISLWAIDADSERFLGGAQIRTGYPHVAATGLNYNDLEVAIAHELTHLSLCHLELPPWIEEGLAQVFSQDATGYYNLRMTAAAARQQKDYWRRNGLDEFWHGEGFARADDDRCAMCYDLAEVLVRLLIADHRPQWFGLLKARQQRLSAFVREAHWSDAGEAAARKHLGFSLGDLASRFLGPGGWSPET